MIGFAQTEKGGWAVSASSILSFSSSSLDGASDNFTSFGLSTDGGYFIEDNLAAGMILSFSSSSNGSIDSNSLTIGPLARYYFNGTFFLSAGFGYTTSKTKTDFGDFTTDGGTLLLQAGYPIWIVDAVAVEPALNYSIGTGDFDGNKTLNLSVGFRLYF